jgi:small GTP-binding protein
VPATGHRRTLTSALDELDTLVQSAHDRDAVTALRHRLGTGRLRVLVAGEAKRGKSTLVNALLGREVLPTGVTPLTAVATTVTYSTDDDAEVFFHDGSTAAIALADLSDFVTERGNPGNRRGVAGVTVRLDAPILARGVELVDTPGTGSVYEHNTDAADTVLPTMDAAVFVLTADPPVSSTERDLLTKVAGLSVARFMVLNKADYLNDAELAEALDFTARVVADAAGEPPRIYPLSARAALTGAATWTPDAAPTWPGPYRRTCFGSQVRCSMRSGWPAVPLRCATARPRSGSRPLTVGCARSASAARMPPT